MFASAPAVTESYKTALRPVLFAEPARTRSVFSRAHAFELRFLETLGHQIALAVERARRGEAERQRHEEARSAYRELHAAQERIIESEKMALLGTFAAGLAHEIRNPPPSRLQELCTTQIPVIPMLIHGLGCSGVNHGPGVRRFGHNGGAPGVSAEFALYPDSGLSLAVLSNHDRRAQPVLKAFEASYFGDAARLRPGMILR